ncbi:rCG27687, isoform CRA_a [Rattus norvegicus]|uniref:RCG27687, isoform CRA_a n=1 Tax=Rattus norvegicus TaxID=10116 RepID=A6KBY1_RAT|nr:rCG27687, isoform CRA_a [Rattus norvegicus]
MASKCPKCDKTVYFAEKVSSLGKDWHKFCLKCERCNKTLTPGGHAEHDGKPFCHKPWSEYWCLMEEKAQLVLEFQLPWSPWHVLCCPWFTFCLCVSIAPWVLCPHVPDNSPRWLSYDIPLPTLARQYYLCSACR